MSLLHSWVYLGHLEPHLDVSTTTEMRQDGATLREMRTRLRILEVEDDGLNKRV
jgi:hypothetical protein